MLVVVESELQFSESLAGRLIKCQPFTGRLIYVAIIDRFFISIFLWSVLCVNTTSTYIIAKHRSWLYNLDRLASAQTVFSTSVRQSTGYISRSSDWCWCSNYHRSDPANMQL